MCKWNNGGIVVDLPAHIMPDRESRTVCIDECIVPQIQALWKEGVQTLGCCCGHGKDECDVILPSTSDPTATATAYWVLDGVDHRRWSIKQWKLVEVAVVTKKEKEKQNEPIEHNRNR